MDESSTQLRRFVQVNYGFATWVLWTVIILAAIQIFRLGLFAADYLILAVGGFMAYACSTFLYATNTCRIDNPDNPNSSPLIQGFFFGASETVVLFFALYLLLYRGLYGAYMTITNFSRITLLSSLAFILFGLVILRALSKLRKVNNFLNRLDKMFAEHQENNGQ